jgi:hypothetical protein
MELLGERRRSTPGASAASRKTVSAGMSQLGMNTVASRPVAGYPYSMMLMVC